MIRIFYGSFLLMLFASIVVPAQAQGSLLIPPQPFRGKIGLSAKDSTTDFPQPVQAPKQAPNVVIVLLDDVGFGASSAFGGPVHTPTLEKLAQNGLRYNQFHTTALCSPTRAALITGRNHHSAHTGGVMEIATGYPGYDSLMGKDTASFAEILRQNGWNTAWFGKNHNVPDWQNSQAGPFDLWPTHLGFEYFYGFIGGDTNQWRPNLFEGTKPIEPYIGNPDYNLDYDLADQAIRWIRLQKCMAPDKPFFVYYAPGATHAPHHPRPEWATKYAGKFDQGWDKVREETLLRQQQLGIVPQDTKLTPRPPQIEAWDSLPEGKKKLFAKMMEIYAGFLEQTDYNAGRVLKVIEDLGQRDNTLVIYMVGDNGASGEGSPNGSLNEMSMFNGVPENYEHVLAQSNILGTWKTYNHYPSQWAHAMDAPFQWTKQIASHYGGTRNGLVISWPRGISDKGTMRSQWHHVTDIAPTILDAAKLTMPNSVNGVAQRPLEGSSIVYSFDHPKADSTHSTQYFEILGNRAIYHDGWIACTTPVDLPWSSFNQPVDVINGYKWELYHVSEDFSESNNVADKYPDKLKELQLLFYAEAARNQVLPLDNSRVERLDPAIRPSLTRGRTSFTYYDGMSRLPEASIPDVKNKSFSIKAEIEIPKSGANGVIATQGGLFSGWALYMTKSRPVFHYNLVNLYHYSIASSQALSPGKHALVLNFKYDGGGIGKGGNGTLLADGKKIAEGRIERTVPIRMSVDEGLDIGQDTGTPVNTSYDVPFKFTGHIDKVTIDTKPAQLSLKDTRRVTLAQQAITAQE